MAQAFRTDEEFRDWLGVPPQAPDRDLKFEDDDEFVNWLKTGEKKPETPDFLFIPGAVLRSVYETPRSIGYTGQTLADLGAAAARRSSESQEIPTRDRLAPYVLSDIFKGERELGRKFNEDEYRARVLQSRQAHAEERQAPWRWLKKKSGEHLDYYEEIIKNDPKIQKFERALAEGKVPLLVEALGSFGPTLGGLMTAMIPVVGSPAALAMFYGLNSEETYRTIKDTLLKNGVSEEDAEAEAQKKKLQIGLVKTALDFMGMKGLAQAYKPASKFLNAAWQFGISTIPEAVTEGFQGLSDTLAKEWVTRPKGETSKAFFGRMWDKKGELFKSMAHDAAIGGLVATGVTATGMTAERLLDKDAAMTTGDRGVTDAAQPPAEDDQAFMRDLDVDDGRVDISRELEADTPMTTGDRSVTDAAEGDTREAESSRLEAERLETEEEAAAEDALAAIAAASGPEGPTPRREEEAPILLDDIIDTPVDERLEDLPQESLPGEPPTLPDEADISPIPPQEGPATPDPVVVPPVEGERRKAQGAREVPAVNAEVSEGEGGVTRIKYTNEKGEAVGDARLMGTTIGDITVKEDFRRQGYGTAILNDLMERGGKTGVAGSDAGEALMRKAGMVEGQRGHFAIEEAIPPIALIKTKDGTFQAVGTHLNVLQEHGINPEDVLDTGMIDKKTGDEIWGGGKKVKGAPKKPSRAVETLTGKRKKPKVKEIRLDPEEREILIKYTLAGKKTAAEIGETQNLVLTAGPPGAGKSTALKGLNRDVTDHVVANADDIKELAGYADQAEAFHEESSLINKEVIKRAMDGGYNSIYDSLMSNFPLADKLISKTLENGGDVDIAMTDIDGYTSVVRSRLRYEKGETVRKVPIEASVKGYNRVVPTFLALFKKYGDNPNITWNVVNNNRDQAHPDDRPARPVFTKLNGVTTVHDQNLLDKLFDVDYIATGTGGDLRYERRQKLTVQDVREAEESIRARIRKGRFQGDDVHDTAQAGRRPVSRHGRGPAGQHKDSQKAAPAAITPSDTPSDKQSDTQEAKLKKVGIAVVPTEDLSLDPARFQFKRGMGKGGAGAKLRGIEVFRPELAGVIAVWKDPADGKTYVVNGHHRYEIASRTGYPEMAVRYLDAETAGQAKLLGALINIAEDQGTPEDAATILREEEITPEQLKNQYGISLKGPLAKKGVALAQLHPGIFDKVLKGELPQTIGVVIGEKVPDEADQLALIELINKKQKGRKGSIGADVVEQMINTLAGADRVTEEQINLFGEEAVERPLLMETAELHSYLIKSLKKDKRLFGLVANSGNAKALQDRGNLIKQEQNLEISKEAAVILDVYNKLAYVGGPVNDLINDAAKELADAKDKRGRDKVKQGLQKKLREAVSRVLQGNRPGVSEGPARYPGLSRPSGKISEDVQGQIREQLALFGAPEEAGFELTPEELTKTEQLARKQDEAKKKGLVPKGKGLTFPAGKAIKTKNVGKQQGLFGPDADQGDLFDQGIEVPGDEQPVYETAKPEEIALKPGKDEGRALPGAGRVQYRTSGRIKAAGNVVKDTGDLASLLARIRTEPDEYFYSVAVDKDGTILEIHEHTKGGRSGAHVFPDTVVGRAVQVPGVAKVYFAHNHPSYGMAHSPEDAQLTNAINRLLNIADIPTQSIIIGGNKFAILTEAGAGTAKRIKPVLRKTLLNKVKRRTGRAFKPQFPELTSSAQVGPFFAQHLNAEDGVLLLTGQNEAVAFLPFVKGRSMKQTTLDILKLAEKTNASTMIIKNDSNSTARKDYIKALVSETVGTLNVLDVLEYGKSFADGEIPGKYGRDSLGQTERDVMLGSDVRLSVVPPTKKTGRPKRGFPHKTVSDIVTNIHKQLAVPELQVRFLPDVRNLGPKRLARFKIDPDRQLVRGLFTHEDGKPVAYFFYNNLDTKKEVIDVAMEEILHFGLFRSLGKGYRDVLDRVYKGHKTAIKKTLGADYEFDLNTVKGRAEAVDEWITKGIVNETLPQNVWRQIVTAVRRMLRAAGIKIHYSTAEIKSIVIDSVSKGQRSEVGGRRSGAPGTRKQVVAWQGGGAEVVGGYQDRFIGSGEGETAFGWGHYFTDLKSIAESYAEDLGNRNLIVYDGVEYSPDEFIARIEKEFGSKYLGVGQIIQYDFRSGYLPDEIYNTLTRMKNETPDRLKVAKQITEGLERASTETGRWQVRLKGGIRDLNKLSDQERSTLFEIQGRAGWVLKKRDPLKVVRADLKKTVKAQKENIAYQKKHPRAADPGRDPVQIMKEAQATLDFMDKHDLVTEWPKGRRHLHKVTIQKGKKPSEYEWLDWDKTVTDKQLDKINKSIDEDYPKGNPLRDSFHSLIESLRREISLYEGVRANGEELYKSISNILGEAWNRGQKEAGGIYSRSGHALADKEASMFLLRAGIDGIRYPAGSLSGMEDKGAKNYVVFDPNVVTVEEHTRYSMEAGKAEERKRVVDLLKNQDGFVSIEGLKSVPVIHDNVLNTAKDMINQGAATYQQFVARMKEIYGEVWDKIKAVMKDLYDTAKKIISSEVGAITIEGKPRKSELDTVYEGMRPEVRERLEASEGVEKLPFWERAKQKIDKVRGSRHHFEHLRADYGHLSDPLRLLEGASERSREKAVEALKGIHAGLGTPKNKRIFELNLVLDDLVKDMESGLLPQKADPDETLPFGFKDMNEVSRELARQKTMADKNPAVKKALEKRTKYMTDLRNSLVENGLLDEAVLKDDRYFHHQVLEHQVIKEMGEEWKQKPGTSTADVRLRKKGWQRARKGSLKDYNTEYIQSEFEVIAQALSQLEIKQTMDTLKDRADIFDGLKEQAKNYNVNKVWDVLRKKGQIEINEKTGEEIDPFTPFKQKTFVANLKLAEMAANGELEVPDQYTGLVEDLADSYNQYMADKKDYPDDPDMWTRPGSNDPKWFPFLGYLVGNKTPGSNWAASVFKTVMERDRFIKKTLGRGFKTYEDFIPEDFQAWDPSVDGVWFKTNMITDQMLEQIRAGDRDLPEKFAQVWARVPAKKWVIPKPLARTMDEFRKSPSDNLVSRAFSKAQSGWKQWTLINPYRIAKYNLNNMSGDADIVLAYAPSIITKYGVKAAKDLARKDPKGKLQEELKLARELDVIGSGWAMQEVEDVTRYLSKDKEMNLILGKKPNLIKRFWQGSKNFTVWRENMLRFAAFRYFRDQIKKGRKPGVDMFAASNTKELKAMAKEATGDELAARLARDLIGDYGNISQAGQWLRRYMIPFYSWMEINAPRYYRLMKNLPKEGGSRSRIPAALGLRVGWKAATLGLKASMLYGAVMLWNRLMFPDEEDELSEAQRRQLHLILGRRDDGSIISIRFQGALSDVLSYVGMEDLPQDLDDLIAGKKTGKEQVKEAGSAFVNKWAQGIRPDIKTSAELMFDRAAYPDVFTPRPIRDKLEHIAGVFSMKMPYKIIAGKPRQGDDVSERMWNDVLSLGTYSSDPGEGAYWGIKKAGFDFLDKEGRSRPSMIPTDKANALYYYKQSLRYGDLPAAHKYLKKYQELGGSLNGMEISVKRSAPLGGFPAALRGKFIKSLSPDQRDKLALAEQWYNNVYKGDKQTGTMKTFLKDLKEKPAARDAFLKPPIIRQGTGRDKAVDLVEDLMEQGLLSMGPPSRYISIGGVRRAMSDAIYQEYLETSSAMARKRIAGIATGAPGARKALAAVRIIKAARKRARAKIKRMMFREIRQRAGKTAS